MLFFSLPPAAPSSSSVPSLISLSLSFMYLFIFYFLPSSLMPSRFQGFWDRLGVAEPPPQSKGKNSGERQEKALDLILMFFRFVPVMWLNLAAIQAVRCMAVFISERLLCWPLAGLRQWGWQPGQRQLSGFSGSHLHLAVLAEHCLLVGGKKWFLCVRRCCLIEGVTQR